MTNEELQGHIKAIKEALTSGVIEESSGHGFVETGSVYISGTNTFQYRIKKRRTLNAADTLNTLREKL